MRPWPPAAMRDKRLKANRIILNREAIDSNSWRLRRLYADHVERHRGQRFLKAYQRAYRSDSNHREREGPSAWYSDVDLERESERRKRRQPSATILKGSHSSNVAAPSKSRNLSALSKRSRH